MASFRGGELFEGLDEEPDIPVIADVWPVFTQDSGGLLLDLGEGDRGEATGFGCYCKTSYTRIEIEVGHACEWMAADMARFL